MGDFRKPWGNIAQLTEQDVAVIQQLLKDRGSVMDKLDGKIGSNTRAEIGSYQRKAGLRVDCWPTAALLQSLKSPAVKSATRP